MQQNKTNLQESHILDVILKYFYNSAICMFTAFAWWRKNSRFVSNRLFFIKYIEGENVPCYFMLKACCPIMVPSAKI